MSIANISQVDFENYIQEGSSLILFFADWCSLCPVVNSYFETLSEELPPRYPHRIVKFAIADFDQHNLTIHKYGIYGTPTVAAFQDGELLETWAGLREEDDYRKILHQFYQYTQNLS
jgi:thioredoxin-like negative regulator of GroEL